MTKERPSIKDLSSKTSLEYNFTHQGILVDHKWYLNFLEKVKSFCLKNDRNPIFNSSSIDFENGSVSTLEPNGGHYDTAPSDFHSVIASEENLYKQKVKTSSESSNELSAKNLILQTRPDSDPEYYSAYHLNARAVTEPDAPIRGIIDDPSDALSRPSLRKNSVYINLEENTMKPIEKVYTIAKKNSSSSQKKPSFAELPPSGRKSSNKKSPNKGRIMNLYASGQFSSNKKGGAHHSKHDSLVIYKTSTNKKCQSKMDSNHKLIGSDFKNYEAHEVRESLQDSPQPLRVTRNLLLN